MSTPASSTLVERAWYGTPPAGLLPLAPLLRAAAWGYGAAAAVRNHLFDAGLRRATRVNARVLSVGNLVAGGAGKTPVVIALAERLVARGKRVAVISRGYGGRGREALVSDGERLLLGARDAGDEPVLIARRVPRVLVLVGPDRVRAAKRAVERHGAQVILLDDGFQHRALARDEDILVLGGRAPLGNGRLLPAGPLRERVDGARRATVAWLSNGAEAAPLPDAIPARRIHARHRPVDLLDARLEASLGLGALRGQRVFLLAGLARPGGFAETVASLGAQVAGARLFADHHPYSPDDVDRVVAEAARAGAAYVVTTEKDAVRLELAREPPVPLCALRVDTEIVHGEPVLQELLDRC